MPYFIAKLQRGKRRWGCCQCNVNNKRNQRNPNKKPDTKIGILEQGKPVEYLISVLMNKTGEDTEEDNLQIQP